MALVGEEVGQVARVVALQGGGQVVDDNQLGEGPVLPEIQAASLGCTHCVGALSQGVLLAAKPAQEWYP